MHKMTNWELLQRTIKNGPEIFEKLEDLINEAEALAHKHYGRVPPELTALIAAREIVDKQWTGIAHKGHDEPCKGNQG